MHQAESSSSSFCLWTGLSLPAALHPVSRRRSCLPLRTDQCFCPMRTFTSLLLRTFRRTPFVPSGRIIPPIPPVLRHKIFRAEFLLSLRDELFRAEPSPPLLDEKRAGARELAGTDREAVTQNFDNQRGNEQRIRKAIRCAGPIPQL